MVDLAQFIILRPSQCSDLLFTTSSIMDGSHVPQQPLFASASGEDPDAFSQFIDVEDFFQGDFYDHDIDYTQLLGVLNSQSGEDGSDDAAPPISLSVGSFGDLTKATDYSLAGNGNSAPLMNQRVFESSGDPLKDVIMIPPMVPLPATSSSSSGRGGSTLFSNRRGGRAEPDAGGDDEDDDDDDDDDEDEYEGEGGKGRKTRRPQKKSKLDSQEAALGSGTEKNRVERRCVLLFPFFSFSLSSPRPSHFLFSSLRLDTQGAQPRARQALTPP